MARGILAIRPAERRDPGAAFFTLFGFIASHSLLETARDALFLAKVPASRLAWMCNLDAVYDLARQSQEVRLEPGEVIWRIGEPSSWWLRVDHGRVRCTSADGASVDLGTRYVLGIMDALGQVPRSYEARAETRVVGYRTDLEPLLAILENRFELARDLLATVSRSLLTIPEAASLRPPPPQR